MNKPLKSRRMPYHVRVIQRHTGCLYGITLYLKDPADAFDAIARRLRYSIYNKHRLLERGNIRLWDCEPMFSAWINPLTANKGN